MEFLSFFQPDAQMVEKSYMGAGALATAHYARQAMILLKETSPFMLHLLLGLTLRGHGTHPVPVGSEHAYVAWLAENNIKLNSYRKFESKLPQVVMSHELEEHEPAVALFSPLLSPQLLNIASRIKGRAFRILFLVSQEDTICERADLKWGRFFDLVVASTASLAALARDAGVDRVVETPWPHVDGDVVTALHGAVSLETVLHGESSLRGMEQISPSGVRTLDPRENVVKVLQGCGPLLKAGRVGQVLWVLEVLDLLCPDWDELAKIRTPCLVSLGY